MSALAEDERQAPDMSRETFMAFLADEETTAVVAAAVKKAGLPENRVYTDGIDKAVSMLSDMETPNLILVDIGSNSNPESVLDRLAEVCDPGTEVIVIGLENDVALYRRLIQMGVRDYLTKPLSEEDLLSALAPKEPKKGPAENSGKEAEIDIVLSAKGGAGASTLAVNTAWSYAHDRGWRTIVLDLDPYFGTTALQLDLEPGRGFREALENPDRVDDLFLERAMVRVDDKFFLLGSEENLSNPIDASEESIGRIIDLTRKGFDRIVVDLPQAQLPYAKPLLEIASSLTVVTDMTLAGLRDVLRIKTAVKELGIGCRFLVVANHVGLSKAGELPQATFEKNLGAELSAMIPQQADLFMKSVEDGKPILAQGKSGKAIAETRKAAQAMSGVKEEKSGGILARLLKGKGGK
ncbi:response regulator [Aestuariispira insulae]|uniref:Pilus assembly protein CpaE n=1 Tax=Aestuariispira insulae TaxID=1461337 RepID=A0A3D9HMY3_9PROT|nr:response regulator [Aestuariispira insulae]RED50853.1 pilus assembly protein CpaE [Aestuariispira insulae]